MPRSRHPLSVRSQAVLRRAGVSTAAQADKIKGRLAAIPGCSAAALVEIRAWIDAWRRRQASASADPEAGA